MHSIIMKCIAVGCNKQASFGYGVVLHCRTHSEPDEVDVVHPHCQTDGCMKIAWFAMPGGPKSHCKVHHMDGEIYTGVLAVLRRIVIKWHHLVCLTR